MSASAVEPLPPGVERQRMDADIVCVGFGPAAGGFLTTLSRGLTNPDGTPAVQSATMPGMPLQILCYERADDIAFGVSGVVTRARSLRESFPGIDQAGIPMAAPVAVEKVLYLLDPTGASRRPGVLRAADKLIRAGKGMLPFEHDAVELPWTPAFLHKTGGLVLSIGQFTQWVGQQLLGGGLVQIWPGVPVAEALIEQGNGDLAHHTQPLTRPSATLSPSDGERDGARHFIFRQKQLSRTLSPSDGERDGVRGRSKVVGVRLMDQGVDKHGRPGDGFMPGMDVRAMLTVVADGPVGAVGRQLDQHFGMPEGRHQYDWAAGMKFVVDLPEDTTLKPGAVFHTFGFPEPEIFGFLYAHPDRVASLGIFVPSWFDSPTRTAYRYLQHWMLHPYLWRHLKGAKLRSWGAKTLGESGRQGEPHLVGDGFARIGEGSGSTNVLTGSGVDEAWATGAQLAEAVVELLKAGKPFTKQNLEETYVRRRRESWVEKEGRVAEKSRDGFRRGVVPGMLGMALASLTKGRVAVPGKPAPPHKRVPSLEKYYRGRVAPGEIARLRKECDAKGVSLHGALMEKAGWPAIPYDGRLLVSHQDALLMGGKVLAPPGCADHVVFLYPDACASCGTKICVEMCSGQAIYPGEGGAPAFDREKCVHCGACLWNCAAGNPRDPEHGSIAFRAGAGGPRSAEN